MDNIVLKTEENKKLLISENKCDKYDYLISVACGALGGMIDSFLVGMPGDSVLSNWTDEQVNHVLMTFAKKLGWTSKTNKVNSAIGFLEKNYRINYDQRNPADVGNLFTMAPSTHHMMSLGHSPDVFGLFFSVLNQFTSTSSFIAEGQLITIKTETFELQGSNIITKILCGIANWFGHLMSDIAGSSGAHSRGTGIVIPFYEFFGFCKFGDFETKNGRKDFSEIAMQAFTKGYDFRFGLTMSIPIFITESLIRLVWGLKRHFQYHYKIRECIPSSVHSSLRVMLLFGNGTLCALDLADAGIRSKGIPLNFFMKLNLIAWFRLTGMVAKEVWIRVGIENSLQCTIDSFQRINEALCLYLSELEKIDLKQYKREMKKYYQWNEMFSQSFSEEQFNQILLDFYKENEFELPWKGKFDKFMSNKSNQLVFK